MKVIKIFLLSFFVLLSGSLFSQVSSIKITELQKVIDSSKTPLVVNFWATWCMPCVEEIPYFIEETNRYNSKAGEMDSVKLILVSLDFKESFPDAIQAFAIKRKFTADILWLNETNADYFCPKVDAKWSGAIPSTLFINNKTGYRKFYEEQLSLDELKQELASLLNYK